MTNTTTEVLAPDTKIDSAETMSTFAHTIYTQKYAFKDSEGNPTETWTDTAYRVTYHVLGALGYTPESVEFQKIHDLISTRKFIPGGRYLYSAGRDLHQVNNCLLLKAEDSREGWSNLLYEASMALMTGAGIGIDYSAIRPKGAILSKTGGEAGGPLGLMEMINECGRHIMQGGSRRSAIWAGLNWRHPDCPQFIQMKNWSTTVRALKAEDFNFPATMDMTNISVLLDDDFFDAYHDSSHEDHDLAQEIYWSTLKHMVKTAEPGFSVDIGENAGETLRNAPVVGNTRVLTENGYERVVDLVNQPRAVWTGKQFAPNVVFKRTGVDVSTVKVTFTGGRSIVCDPSHEFLIERFRGAGRRHFDHIDRVAASELQEGDILHTSLTTPYIDSFDIDSYTLGYLYGDGSFNKTGGAEITFCTEESKACARIIQQSNYDQFTNWDDSRGYVRTYFRTDPVRLGGRTHYKFPSHMYTQTPDSIASFIAGLWDADGNYDSSQHRVRLASSDPDFLRDVGRLLEQLGILAGVAKNGHSTYGDKQEYQLVVMADYVGKFADLIPTQRVIIDDLADWEPYRASTLKVLSVEDDIDQDVYCANVDVPEHSLMAEGVIISNCTELSSRDSSDVCNLGSLNLSRFESLKEFEEAVEYSTLFLLAGTVYSHVPYERVAEIREKNRRLGLGLMGVHEWLLKRNYRYEPNDELGTWLEVYATSTESAHRWAKKHHLSPPIKTRAIAPAGTIGIVGETTTGIEPIFCVAYKRRYLANGTSWKYQYVIDPTAKRIIEKHSVDPDSIEDAYTLAYNVERRIAMQAFIQHYVDHGISSTINTPYPMVDDDEVLDFGNTLMVYLPDLRGVTVYPDGARGGQPLTSVPYHIAIQHEGVVFEESADRCVGGQCGV